VSGQNQEQLIFSVVTMPDEFSAELDQLDGLTVELTNDAGPPVFRDGRQLGGEVDRFRRNHRRENLGKSFLDSDRSSRTVAVTSRPAEFRAPAKPFPGTGRPGMSLHLPELHDVQP
jgi:hypothetical protein